MTMLDEYGDDKQDGCDDDQRELILQAALFMVVVMLVIVMMTMLMMTMLMMVIMLVMMFVLAGAAITMLMCHIFAV